MNKTISRREFRKEVIESSALTIVNFKTKWSGACQIIEPVYNDLARTYSNQVNFYTIDVETETGIDREYGIMELPTILFFESGKIIDHATGLTSRNMLITKIENAIAHKITDNKN
jgi:thioredoxin-like negative regulator of GroEL